MQISFAGTTKMKSKIAFEAVDEIPEKRYIPIEWEEILTSGQKLKIPAKSYSTVIQRLKRTNLGKFKSKTVNDFTYFWLVDVED